MSVSKLLMSTAANQYSAPTYIEDVFSTYLYTGNDSTQTITNGIDLAGEGGMVWIKGRSAVKNNALYDTERGVNQYLYSNSTLASTSGTNMVTAFNSDGFSIGSNALVNEGPITFASWTFRKAPRFFDVVTYTGTGSAQTIAHNLGTTVGTLIVKRTDSTGNWGVFHRSEGPSKYGILHDNLAFQTDEPNAWNGTAPTDTEFSVGAANVTNISGGTYVAYLFAHDPLGPSGDGSDGLIACGSFAGGTIGQYETVSLGWEPQWLLLKRSDGAGSWFILDNMRGIVTGGDDKYLLPHLSIAEGPQDVAEVTSTGFRFLNTTSPPASYIYIAIRRGPMRQPTAGTEVFATEIGDGVSTKPALYTGFPVDAAILKLKTGGNSLFGSRLQGPNYMEANTTSVETDDSGWTYDYMDGWYGGTARNSNFVNWSFRRAPGFFDVVAYSGTGTERGVPHNLGVTPEMLIIKARDFSGKEWFVHHTGLTSWSKVLQLQSTGAESNGDTGGNLPTETTFPVNSSSNVNGSGYNYIAYLFASLDGVSKVGSYTGNGSSQTIDCGFTSGARFVMIKRTDTTGSWNIADTERGIVDGADPYLHLNDTNSEFNGVDVIDPHPSGFTLPSGWDEWNASGGSYIFYAIA